MDAEWPAVKNAPAPKVNVWEERQTQMELVEQMKPHNESEEEAMLRQALELSRLQALEDQKRQSEIEEEYYLQRKYLLENPEFAAQLDVASDEICGAASLGPGNQELVESHDDVNYQPVAVPAFSPKKGLYDVGKSKPRRNQQNDSCTVNNEKYNSHQYMSNRSEELKMDIVDDSDMVNGNHEFRGAKPKHKQKGFRKEDSQEGNNVKSDLGITNESYDIRGKGVFISARTSNRYDDYDDGAWGDVEQSSEFSGKKQHMSAQPAKQEDDYNDSTWDYVDQSKQFSTTKEPVSMQPANKDDGTWGDYVDPSCKFSTQKQSVSVQPANENGHDDDTWKGVDQSYEFHNKKKSVPAQPVNQGGYCDDGGWDDIDQSVLAQSANHNDDWNEGSQDNIKGEEVDEFESVSNYKGCVSVAAPSGRESQKGSTKILDMSCQGDGHHRNDNMQEQLHGGTPGRQKFISNNTLNRAQDVYPTEKTEGSYSKDMSSHSGDLPQSYKNDNCHSVCVSNKAGKRKSVLDKEALLSKPHDFKYEHVFAHSSEENTLYTSNSPWEKQPVLHSSEDCSGLELDTKDKKIDSSKHDTWAEDLEHMQKSIKGFHLSIDDRPDSQNTLLVGMNGRQTFTNTTIEPTPNIMPPLQESSAKVGVNKVEQWLASAKNEAQQLECSSGSKNVCESENRNFCADFTKSAVPVISQYSENRQSFNETPANGISVTVTSNEPLPHMLPTFTTGINGPAAAETNSLTLNNQDMPLQPSVPNVPYPPCMPFGHSVAPQVEGFGNPMPSATSLLWQQAVMCSNPFIMQQLHALQMFYVSLGVPVPQGFLPPPALFSHLPNMIPHNPGQSIFGPQQNIQGYPVPLSAPVAASPVQKSDFFQDPYSPTAVINPPVPPSNSFNSMPPGIRVGFHTQEQTPSANVQLLSGDNNVESDHGTDFIGIPPPKPCDKKPVTTEIKRRPLYRYSDLCPLLQQSSTVQNLTSYNVPKTNKQ